jgi:hypothetical protein
MLHAIATQLLRRSAGIPTGSGLLPSATFAASSDRTNYFTASAAFFTSGFTASFSASSAPIGFRT